MFPDVFLETGLEPSELMENVRKFPPGGWRSLENEGGKKKTLLPGRDMFLQTGFSIITPDIVLPGRGVGRVPWVSLRRDGGRGEEIRVDWQGPFFLEFSPGLRRFFVTFILCVEIRCRFYLFVNSLQLNKCTNICIPSTPQLYLRC